MTTASTSASFSIPDARRIVSDLCLRKPVIYWFDAIGSLVAGYGFGALYMAAPFGSLQQLGSLAIASFALFRAGSFIHEISHMKRGEMLGFQAFWNVAAGVPMLMPSFFYSNHIDHHNTHHYGTEKDGEYLPLGASSLRHIVLFLAQAPILPIYIFARFLLSPVTFATPRFRQWTLERASSFVINYRHRLAVPKKAPRKVWALLEMACWLRCVLLVALVGLGFHEWTWILRMYALAVCVLSLNYNRNLVAHHYRNTGREMSHAEQLADSVNITGDWLWTELFFPLGLRYHALHHLFPALPYHNLGLAHRRLLAQLPADSPYRETVYPSYWSVLGKLVVDARGAAVSQPRVVEPQTVGGNHP